MTKLTMFQNMHLPTIQYFLSDVRATGKTEILAWAYLLEAIEHPGKTYYPIDFPHEHIQNKNLLLKRIVMLAQELNLPIKFHKIDISFHIDHVNPYLNEEIHKQFIETMKKTR